MIFFCLHFNFTKSLIKLYYYSFLTYFFENFIKHLSTYLWPSIIAKKLTYYYKYVHSYAATQILLHCPSINKNYQEKVINRVV